MIDEKINSKERDYDKEPIVIEDYNPLFLALYALSFVPIVLLIYIYNPGGTSEESLFRNMVIIVPTLMYPFFVGYFKSRGKRKIVLNSQSISFLHKNRFLNK